MNNENKNENIGTENEQQYLDLLKKVLDQGKERIGRNGKTFSLFGESLEFNLMKGFPLLTTRKMFFRGIFEELMFFINGKTDSKLLEEKKVNIWKGNTSREFLDSLGFENRKVGLMGPMYGFNWRFFGCEYNQDNGQPGEFPIQTNHTPCEAREMGFSWGTDQLANVVDLIRNNPNSRRIMMTTLNPDQLHLCVLPPCHSIVLQFYVDGDFLDMYCFNRSSDLFHGLPFNIASSAMLLKMIAEITGKTARYFKLSLGDSHIYESHIPCVKEQLSREPLEPPELVLNTKPKTLKEIEYLNYCDCILVDYNFHSSIKAPMVV